MSLSLRVDRVDQSLIHIHTLASVLSLCSRGQEEWKGHEPKHEKPVTLGQSDWDVALSCHLITPLLGNRCGSASTYGSGQRTVVYTARESLSGRRFGKSRRLTCPGATRPNRKRRSFPSESTGKESSLFGCVFAFMRPPDWDCCIPPSPVRRAAVQGDPLECRPYPRSPPAILDDRPVPAVPGMECRGCESAQHVLSRHGQSGLEHRR